MIASSPLAKALCSVVAAVLVVGATTFTRAPAPVVIEGGGEALEARIGSSFADMSIGVLSAVTPQTLEAVTTAAAPLQAQPVTTILTPQAVATAVTPPLAAHSSPLLTTAVARALPKITATESASMSPQSSPRPKLRDPVLAAAAAPKPVAKPKVQPRTAPRGNAARANTKGAASGAKSARATSKGTQKSKPSQNGNAAASSYPGQVMRRIARVSKPRVNSRGAAVVAFSISGSGGLSGLSISRSSGSSALDQAALRVIQKAAPFPAPPRGAQRNFSITIKGR